MGEMKMKLNKYHLIGLFLLLCLFTLIGIFIGMDKADKSCVQRMGEIENTYERFMDFEHLNIDINLSVTTLQDDKWYYCYRLGDSRYGTYAFINKATNKSYGVQVERND